MLLRPPVGRRALGSAWRFTLAVWTSLALACPHPQLCQDPTREGACFCPVGMSCHHECGLATGHCTLGCSQANPSCSVSCTDDCTALCAGAGRCDTVCGDRCNVSCEWVKQICAATVGSESHVNCEGAKDCDIRCNGACEVSCPSGHCRLRCAEGGGGRCNMSCGGIGSADRPVVCPDGTQVCGRSC